MNYISFTQPQTIEQIDAIANLQKSIFTIAEAYGLTNRADLLDGVTSSIAYELSSLLEKQTVIKRTTPRVEDLNPDQSDDLAVDITPIVDPGTDKSTDIDLDNIPF